MSHDHGGANSCVVSAFTAAGSQCSRMVGLLLVSHADGLWGVFKKNDGGGGGSDGRDVAPLDRR